jgi:hypothetical protein
VVQMAWVYSPDRAIAGKTRTVYYHVSFDDTDTNSLHVTFADTAVYANRTWAIRSSFTPTARRFGTWSASTVNLGNALTLNQQGISTLIASKIGQAQTTALADFFGNAAITTLLDARFPAPAPPAVVASRWAALPPVVPVAIPPAAAAAPAAAAS